MSVLGLLTAVQLEILPQLRFAEYHYNADLGGSRNVIISFNGGLRGPNAISRIGNLGAFFM